MVRRLEILCSVKNHQLSPYECVTHIGGLQPDGSAWRLSVPEAIEGIRTRRWEFYVLDPAGQKQWVHVTVSRNGVEYLKTFADREVPHLIMSLPSCEH